MMSSNETNQKRLCVFAKKYMGAECNALVEYLCDNPYKPCPFFKNKNVYYLDSNGYSKVIDDDYEDKGKPYV